MVLTWEAEASSLEHQKEDITHLYTFNVPLRVRGDEACVR